MGGDATKTPDKMVGLPRRPLFARPTTEDIKAKADRASRPQATAAKLKALAEATKAAADRADTRAAERKAKKGKGGSFKRRRKS